MKGYMRMKKRSYMFIFLLLAVLLITGPAAYADTTYSAPEAVEAGTELTHLVATVSAESSVSANQGTLPAGVDLGTEEAASGNEDMQDIYLRGVPTTAGEYNCVITISAQDSSSLIVCPISILPSVPTVTASAPVRCYVGDAVKVSVEAFVADGGVLSYQWYSNTAMNSTNGTLMENETEPVLTVSTARTGTAYYYCVVTNINGEETASVTSDIIPVTVEEIAVTSITVETLPGKTVYALGEGLDVTGLSIRVRYSNNASVVITDGFSVSPWFLQEEGVVNVEVSYEGLTCTFQVTVEQPEEIIEGIGVLTLPDRRDYSVGDTLEMKGLSIRVYTNLGYRDVLAEELSCSPMVFEKAGSQTVTVSYEDKTCTFTLEIEEEERPERLLLGILPNKIQYTVGDTLDTTGLVLTLVSSKGNQQSITSGYSCSPTLLDTAGRTEIRVSYGELSCSFNVTVAAAPASPSPSVPVQTPAVQAPVTQAPQTAPPTTPATPHVSNHQSHDTGAGNGVLVLLIVAALVALAGLGLYVFIMNRGGIEQIRLDLRELTERIKEKFNKK